MSHKNIAVLYHGDCPDGFGGAFAAWRKFGDTADYYPIKYGHEPLVEEVRGREAYMIDFCYPKDTMDKVLAAAKSLVVLDHHEGIQDVVKSMPNHVFDDTRSGATIAWGYFHPDTPVPLLFQILQDEDLWHFKLPETKPVGVYLWTHEFTFENWDKLATQLEDPEKKVEILKKAEAYLEYFNRLVEITVDHSHPIEFEGHTILMATSSPMKTLKSAIGNALLKKKPPFALVVSVHPKGLGVSIRGDGTIDVSAIARKYGGNGHPNSSGFHIPWQLPMPFTSAEEPKKHEDSRG